MRFDRPCRRVERALNDLAEKVRVLIVEVEALRQLVEEDREAMRTKAALIRDKGCPYCDAGIERWRIEDGGGVSWVHSTLYKNMPCEMQRPPTPREQFSQEAMRNPKFKIASGDSLGFVIGGARPK